MAQQETPPASGIRGKRARNFYNTPYTPASSPYSFSPTEILPNYVTPGMLGGARPSSRTPINRNLYHVELSPYQNSPLALDGAGFGSALRMPRGTPVRDWRSTPRGTPKMRLGAQQDVTERLQPEASSDLVYRESDGQMYGGGEVEHGQGGGVDVVLPLDWDGMRCTYTCKNMVRSTKSLFPFSFISFQSYKKKCRGTFIYFKLTTKPHVSSIIILTYTFKTMVPYLISQALRRNNLRYKTMVQTSVIKMIFESEFNKYEHCTPHYVTCCDVVNYH